MNCTACRRLIEDFHDDEMTEKRAAAVRNHLAGCPACTGELQVLKSEQALFERYRRNQDSEVSGAESKWESIRESIAGIGERSEPQRWAGQNPSSHRLDWLQYLTGFPLVRQAAFAVLLVALSIAGTLIIVNKNHSNPSAPVGSTSAETEGRTAPVSIDANSTGLESAMRAVRRAEQEYIQAIQLLNEIVARRKPSLDPRLVREIERNLKAIDESITATRKAYYERPSDPELAQFMLAAYSKKVELLQELAT